MHFSQDTTPRRNSNFLNSLSAPVSLSLYLSMFVCVFTNNTSRNKTLAKSSFKLFEIELAFIYQTHLGVKSQTYVALPTAQIEVGHEDRNIPILNLIYYFIKSYLLFNYIMWFFFSFILFHLSSRLEKIYFRLHFAIQVSCSLK